MQFFRGNLGLHFAYLLLFEGKFEVCTVYSIAAPGSNGKSVQSADIRGRPTCTGRAKKRPRGILTK